MKNFLKIWTMALMVALSFAACNKDDDKPTDDSGVPANNLKDGEVRIRVKTSYEKKVSFYARAKTLNIVWGDGSTEILTPNGTEYKFEHTYAIDGVFDIYLQTTELIYFKAYDGKDWRILFGTCDLNKFEMYKGGYYNGGASYLDFSKCARLAALDNNIDVDSLNIANCSALKIVRCSTTCIEWLNVKGCTALEELEFYGESIDVSTCTALKKLVCNDNYYDEVPGLTSLDVSKNTKLEYLDCGHNQLTSLDVSKNTELTSLSCNDNQLNAAALNSLFQSLSTLQGYRRCSISGNPGTETCDKSIAEKKGWNLYY